MALDPWLWIILKLLFSDLVGYQYYYPNEPFVSFYGLILVQIHQFTFLMTLIQCLSDHTTEENESSFINMNNYHIFYHPSCIIWTMLSHWDFEGSLYVIISPATPTIIFLYSDYVSWASQNSRKMALAPQIWITTKMVFSHLIEYGYHCLIDHLVSFYRWILVDYWLIYAHFYILWLRFSVFVITK